VSIFFIGRGALLVKAVEFALDNAIEIKGVSCLPRDFTASKIKKLGLDIHESSNPNKDLLATFSSNNIQFVFSINNKFILDNNLLSTGPRFINIHSGLIQSYRGIGELCIVMALCREESIYGVTMHELLPNQEVDCGPVIGQITFPITQSDDFSSVMNNSLRAAHEIFKSYLLKILSSSAPSSTLKPSTNSYTYRNFQESIELIDKQRLEKFSNLGKFAGFFPKLNLMLKTHFN
jgi:methionyl-tRNA formyltransferase